jgi:hypothetical protein
MITTFGFCITKFMKSEENTGPHILGLACLLALLLYMFCGLHTPEVLALALALSCFLLFPMLFPSFLFGGF